MWPELWLRRFVTSPVTQISPTCFPSRSLTCRVRSVTDSTLRVSSRGNSSPKSHCDLTGLGIAAFMDKAAHALLDFLYIFDSNEAHCGGIIAAMAAGALVVRKDEISRAI